MWSIELWIAFMLKVGNVEHSIMSQAVGTMIDIGTFYIYSMYRENV